MNIARLLILSIALRDFIERVFVERFKEIKSGGSDFLSTLSLSLKYPGERVKL